MSAGRLHGMERCTVRTRLSRGHESFSRALSSGTHTRFPFSAVQTLVDSALCAAISPLLPCEQIPQCDLAHSPRSLVGTYPYHSELLYSGVDSGVDSGAPRRSTVGLKRYSGADALAAASGVTVAANAAAVLTTSRLHSGQDGGGRDASLAVSSAVTHVTTRR